MHNKAWNAQQGVECTTRRGLHNKPSSEASRAKRFDLLGSIYVRETVFLSVKIMKMSMVDENPQKLGKLTQLASTRLIGKVNGHWES